jgi:hypothetical protein
MKTARVRTVGGVPRIEVDGKPTRARLFWGGASASPVPIGAEREITFSFVAPLTTQTGTIHFRFGRELGKVGVRGVRIVEAGSGRVVLGAEPAWKVWPPTEESHVEFGAGGFVAHVVAPPPGKEWPDFHVFHEHQLKLTKGKIYQVSLSAEATPARSLTVALYQPGTSYTFLAGPSVQFESQVKLAAAVGVNIVSFEVALPWPAPGEPLDFQASDAACERVLAANPKALLLPRIGVYPPPHWLKSHPDDVMRWDDGDHGGGMASAASVAYQRDGAEHLSALVTHLEATFGERMIGYHPTGQNTGEWFWMDSWTGALPGYTACDRTAWDAWRAAQKLPPAPVPTPAERKAKTPSPTVVDFHRFLSETIADAALVMASAVRNASKGKKLSLLFYGYGFEFAPMPSGPANSGHYALHKLLTSPAVDIICGPFSYFDRSIGGVGPVMSAAESVLAAGKLWLNEDDTRTYLAKERTFPGWDSGADTLEGTLGVLRRNLAQNACRNHATWWMDLPGTGWFDDPKLWEEIRRFAAWDDYFLAHPTPFKPEIALVLDETTAYQLSPNAAQNAPLSTTRKALGLVGAPYGQYLLTDVLAGTCPAKVLVVLTTSQRIALERRATGKALVFVDEKGVTTEVLRAACRAAKVHLYTQTDAVVFANEPLIAVHAVKDGPVTVTPRRGGKPVTLTLKKGETALLL